MAKGKANEQTKEQFDDEQYEAVQKIIELANKHKILILTWDRDDVEKIVGHSITNKKWLEYVNHFDEVSWADVNEQIETLVD